MHTLLFATLLVLLLGATSVSAAKKTGFVTQGGKTYYIKKDGSKQKGWLELNGQKYYFDAKTGVQLKGWAKDSSGKLTRYFTKGTGTMVTGFLTDSKGVTRYFDPKTGLLTRGWLELKGDTYYFTSGVGAMAKGWLKNSKDQKRYFASNGKMKKGWVKNAKKQYRYFSEKNGIMATGLTRVGDFTYYFSEEDGYRYQKGFLKLEGKTYYFALKNGRAQKGWLELKGKTYYFGENFVMYVSTTATVDNEVYTFDKNGVASRSEYVTEGNNIKIYDPKNDRTYKIWKTYLDHPGIASGELSDLDILAALCETEAGDQGHEGMVAVALCVLNRTIIPTKEFPSQVRQVIFHGGSFAQYSVVSNGRLISRLNGQWENRAAAYKAAKEALKLFEDHVKFGKPRKVKGFPKKDFDYMYFMMEDSFKQMPNLNFNKLDKFLYKDHMFFVDWITL